MMFCLGLAILWAIGFATGWLAKGDLKKKQKMDEVSE